MQARTNKQNMKPGATTMPSPIRMIYSGGSFAELLTLIPQLRPATRCDTADGSTFFFYQGRLSGGPHDEQRLAHLLDQPEASVEVLSTENFADLLQDGTPIHGLILDYFRKKDESRRNGNDG